MGRGSYSKQGKYHRRYVLADGEPGGQTIIGGRAAGEDLTLQPTSHATKGQIFFGSGKLSVYDEFGADRLGIGVTSPADKIHAKVTSGACYVRVESSDTNSTAGLRCINDARSWALVVNSSDNLVVEDVTGATTPVTIEGGAGTDTLVVDSNSRVGVGTASPQRRLHLEDTVPILRLSDSDATTDAEVTGSIEFWRGNATNQVGSFGYLSSGDENFYLRNDTSGGDIRLRTAGANDRLTIDSAGRVGIGTTGPATSALLELLSTTGALLVPRMTTTQRNALTAANGMIVYNTTTNAFNFYENGSWVSGSGLA